MLIVDQEGRIELANNQAAQLFGYSDGRLEGQKVGILVPARFRAKHPGHRAGFFSEPRTRAMGVGLDLPGLRRDGTEFPVEISLSPVKTPDGDVVISAIRDVSTRKTEEDKFRALLESAPDANQSPADFPNLVTTRAGASYDCPGEMKHPRSTGFRIRL